MKWEERPREIAYLLNPAFCGEILRNAIKEYNSHSGPFPYVLAYLILPIVLHKKTRERIHSRSKMHTFLQKNPDLKIGFAERARQLVTVTNESLTFLMQLGYIELDDARLKATSKRTNKINIDTYTEIYDCFQKALIVGRWFARSENTITVFTMWGVRP